MSVCFGHWICDLPLLFQLTTVVEASIWYIQIKRQDSLGTPPPPPISHTKASVSSQRRVEHHHFYFLTPLLKTELGKGCWRLISSHSVQVLNQPALNCSEWRLPGEASSEGERSHFYLTKQKHPCERGCRSPCLQLGWAVDFAPVEKCFFLI